MKLAPGISLVPYFHGKAMFAARVRELCSAERFDCIAVDISESFQDHLGPAVENLPYIQAVVARDFSDSECWYVPVDPCDAAIEGVRQSFQNHVPYACIGRPLPAAPGPLRAQPDEYSIKKTGVDVFAALCLQAIGNPARGSDGDLAGAYCTHRLHELAGTYKNILALVHFRSYTRAVHHFRERAPGASGVPQPYRISSYHINPDHLYFALGELPFITGKSERERQDPFAAPVDAVTEIKSLFCETRDDYYDRGDDSAALSPSRIQAALTFLRNLTVQSGFLIPSLFDIVEAAKGVGGNAYALRILKNARYYPYLPFELGEPLLGVGIDRITLPDTGETVRAVNLFRDIELEWRTLSIKPDPSLERKKKYRYAWNPSGMCSHVPEDDKIERFNERVRTKAMNILLEEFAKCEKFTTSVKDGIDIRETLRNWNTGGIYVKEIPPARGRLDAAVIIFDEDHDERYPHQTTWYAEHNAESTLAFYATDPFADLIGPGIARCRYGGLSLLFPPRPVPNIFELTENAGFPNLSARLAYGALLYSGERVVAYVSGRRPGVYLRTLASRMKKHLVWIPLASFSGETIRKLRTFHVLNGKEVRTWASRFIGED